MSTQEQGFLILTADQVNNLVEIMRHEGLTEIGVQVDAGGRFRVAAPERSVRMRTIRVTGHPALTPEEVSTAPPHQPVQEQPSEPVQAVGQSVVIGWEGVKAE
jgi:hypothetical protein